MPDTNYNLLKMMIERWNAHDIEYSYRLLADHYREHLNGVLVKNGRADAREADQFLYATVRDHRGEIDDFVCE